MPTTMDDYPSFRQWRKRHDAVMRPDKGFTKQLKCLDPEFDVVWDWGSEKWEIWKFPKFKPEYHVLTVETKDKTYRQLGADILIRLQESMVWDKFTLSELVAYFDELDNQVRRRKERDLSNAIESIVKETFNYYHMNIVQIQVPQKYKVRREIDGSKS